MHYTSLSLKSGVLDAAGFEVYVKGMLHLSDKDIKCCKKLIPVEKVEAVLGCCVGHKSLGSDSLTYELYAYMLDLFAPVLVAVHYSWQQTGSIPSCVRQSGDAAEKGSKQGGCD